MAKAKPKASAKPSATKAAGRPNGATTKPRDQIDVATSRCQKCGSTERASYTSKEEVEHGGTDAAGQPYTHVVWRRTKCLACGQHRIDRSVENRAKPQRK